MKGDKLTGTIFVPQIYAIVIKLISQVVKGKVNANHVLKVKELIPKRESVRMLLVVEMSIGMKLVCVRIAHNTKSFPQTEEVAKLQHVTYQMNLYQQTEDAPNVNHIKPYHLTKEVVFILHVRKTNKLHSMDSVKIAHLTPDLTNIHNVFLIHVNLTNIL